MIEQEIYIVVKGHSIKKSLTDIVQARVLARVEVLSDYPAYTLPKICGYDFWNPMTKEERINAGIFVSYQVEIGALPLRHVERKYQYPKHYRFTTNSTFKKEL